MIGFDVTRAARTVHHSGLQRVSTCLRARMAAAPARVVPVVWEERRGGWRRADGGEFRPSSTDWVFTPELFGPEERPGFEAWLESRACRAAAVFYDAIPLKLPHVTWARSVARHPGHLKMLARFDRVLAISEASRQELLGFWAWSRPAVRAAVTTIPLGADGDGRPRATESTVPSEPPAALVVGILEPRKNQTLLLDAWERLGEAARDWRLHVVGRVNPEFGHETAKRVREVSRRCPGVVFHGALDDAALAEVRARCRLALFPSLAEGNGLPVLEALWHGLPCICSTAPALLEHAAGGGCVALPADDPGAWAEALARLMPAGLEWQALRAAAVTRPLPTWDESARAVLAVVAD